LKTVLRRIFGQKRDEVTGEWRKLHIEELHNFCSSPDIVRQIKSRRMRLAGNVVSVGDERKLHKVLVEKPEGKRQLRRSRRRWWDGIRLYLGETGWRGVGWIQLAQARDRLWVLVNTVMSLRLLAPQSWLVSSVLRSGLLPSRFPIRMLSAL
jgi:hypothetical protein